MSYQLTQAASSDLLEIWFYIAAEAGEAMADRVDADLHKSMQRIGEAPGLGHVRLDLGDETLRFVPVHKYLILYRPDTRPVRIMRVVHGARDVAAALHTKE